MFRFGKNVKFCIGITFRITEIWFDLFYDVTSCQHYSGSLIKNVFIKLYNSIPIGLDLKMSKSARNSVTEKMVKVIYFIHFHFFFSSNHV